MVFGDEEFGGLEAGEFVVELSDVGEFGDGELAGGVIDAGEAKGFCILVNGGEVVRAMLVEEVGVIDGASGEDAGDLAFDEFAGFGVGGLLGDGDAESGFEKSGEVGLGGVPWDAAHGGEVAFGEGHVEDRGGGFGVLEEHFIEVAQAVEEDHVRWECASDGLVLCHHGCDFAAAHVWGQV